MKRILFFLSLLPYLATAQVAKDTVTVLTIADIPAAEIRDTTNFTFVQDNGFKKATFDSLAKYTRVKLLATGAITSAELANALSNETGTGAAVFATSPALTTPNLGTPSAATLTNATGLPISTGLTGLGAANRIPYATSATAMATDTAFTYTGTALNAPRLFLTGTQPNVTQTLQRASGDYAFSIFEATARNLTTNLSTNILNYGVFGSLNSGATPPSLTYSYFSVGSSGAYDNTHVRLYPDASKTVSFDGRVGIGTTTPAVALEVSGILLFQNNNAIRFKNSSGTVRNILFYSTSNNTHILSPDSEIIFETSAARMRVKNDGEVFIAGNTDQGAYNLQVNGTGVWGAGAYVNGSDREIKENIENLDSALHLVNSLVPVKYNYKESHIADQSKQIGFIAQDVFSVLGNTDFAESVVKSDGEVLSMAYSNLIPLLTKAIQEQQAQIEQLKQRITQLENK